MRKIILVAFLHLLLLSLTACENAKVTRTANIKKAKFPKQNKEGMYVFPKDDEYEGKVSYEWTWDDDDNEV